MSAVNVLFTYSSLIREKVPVLTKTQENSEALSYPRSAPCSSAWWRRHSYPLPNPRRRHRRPNRHRRHPGWMCRGCWGRTHCCRWTTRSRCCRRCYPSWTSCPCACPSCLRPRHSRDSSVKKRRRRKKGRKIGSTGPSKIAITFRMKVVSLCLMSSWKLCPHALQVATNSPLRVLALITVSGFSHSSQSTNLSKREEKQDIKNVYYNYYYLYPSYFLMNPSSISWSLAASCEPLTM